MSEWKTTQPKKEGQYLITTTCGTKNIVDLACFTKNLYKIDHYDFSEYKGKRKAGWYTYDSEYGYVEYDDVLAWQELPFPYYKEKEKEE